MQTSCPPDPPSGPCPSGAARGRLKRAAWRTGQWLGAFGSSCYLFLASPAFSVSAAPTDTPETVVRLVQKYVEGETRAIGDQVVVRVSPLGPATRIADCANPEVYTPRGVRLWGKTRVSVRCTHPASWLIHVPVDVRVSGRYLASSFRIEVGHVLSDPDFTILQGELTTLPDDLIVRPEQARGQRVRRVIEAGQPLRKDHLQRELLVRQGQTVRIVVRQPGFSVSSEGVALASGAMGDLIRVKNPSGRVVQGKATAEGVVEIRP